MKNQRILALAKLIENTKDYHLYPGDSIAIAEGLLEQGVRVPQSSLHEVALDAAEKEYWRDNGVSRHNLAVAIRTYLLLAGIDAPSEPVDYRQLREKCEKTWGTEHPFTAWVDKLLRMSERGL